LNTYLKLDKKSTQTKFDIGYMGLHSILIVIFLHDVARSFCAKIKLPNEMPKIAKCLKLRYSIDLKKEKSKVCYDIHLLISGFSC
jgi:hypothetical protein